MKKLKSPYVWPGGKSAIASVVWNALGDVNHFVEPFFGSGAVLLARPHPPKTETINDKDDNVVNFWRALQADPDGLAVEADQPVHETSLHAWHLWLTEPKARKKFHRLMVRDPDYYHLKRAARWVNGLCQWIGTGWCRTPRTAKVRHLGGAGRGIHKANGQLPHLGDAGKGIHRTATQIPHLSGEGNGIHSAGADLLPWFRALANRLRRVRVCCGDWSRVCSSDSTTTKFGTTGVFLDPPYSTEADRHESTYAEDSGDVAKEVREWCKEFGPKPGVRVVLAGYAGEGHEELEALGWSVLAWKSRGGYGSQGEGRGRANSVKERLWLSPQCLRGRKLNSLL